MAEEVVTEVTTNPTEDTPNGEVTDEVKVEDTDNEVTPESEDEDDEDPIASYQKTWEETRKAQLEEEARAKVRAELEAEQETARRQQLDEQQKRDLNEAFAETVKKMRSKVEGLKFYDADGEEVKFDDATFQQLVDPWQEYNAKTQTAGISKGYSDWADATVKLLPADKRDEFAKRAHQKPLAEYLKQFAELYADKTEFAKKQTEEVQLKIKAAEARGYAKGQKAPAGTPKQGTDKPLEARGEVIEIGNLYDAARALRLGQISDSDYVTYHKKFTS